MVLQDARALHEFAQAKLQLTAALSKSQSIADQQVRTRLLQEAAGYLERVIQMEAPPTRHAWAWFNLGQARQKLGAARQDVIDAYEKAAALGPLDHRFSDALAKAKSEA